MLILSVENRTENCDEYSSLMRMWNRTQSRYDNRDPFAYMLQQQQT